MAITKSFLLLAASLLLTSSSRAQGQSETCSGLGIAGIPDGDECCPASCGQCGGASCGTQDSGSDAFYGSEACCSTQVFELDRPCSENKPPCSGADTTDIGGDDDFSSSPSDNDIVEVGMKTGVSVVATAHDARASLSSDEGGCGEYGYGGCEPMLTRDGITSEIESRWSCATKIVEDEGPCEIEFIFDEPQDIVDIEVAFWMGDERTRTLEVLLDGAYALTHDSYSEATFTSLGVEADGVSRVMLTPISLEPDEWISLLEVFILVKN